MDIHVKILFKTGLAKLYSRVRNRRESAGKKKEVNKPGVAINGGVGMKNPYWNVFLKNST